VLLGGAQLLKTAWSFHTFLIGAAAIVIAVPLLALLARAVKRRVPRKTESIGRDVRSAAS
jgi:hypothetical protein